MASDYSNFPRRYFPDGDGQRVIVGLTVDETSEFEQLDTHQAYQSDRDVDDRGTARQRWLELYAKHAAAWDQWTRQSKLDRTMPSAALAAG